MIYMLVAIFLTSCSSSTPTYQSAMQQWVGSSSETLYEYWGTPSSEIYLSPYTKVVTFTKTQAQPINGNTEPYAGIEVAYQAIDGENYGSYLSNNDSNDYYCQTTFTITNNVITDYTFNGDDCISSKN